MEVVAELDMVAEARLIFGPEAARQLADKLGVAVPDDDEPEAV